MRPSQRVGTSGGGAAIVARRNSIPPRRTARCPLFCLPCGPRPAPGRASFPWAAPVKWRKWRRVGHEGSECWLERREQRERERRRRRLGVVDLINSNSPRASLFGGSRSDSWHRNVTRRDLPEGLCESEPVRGVPERATREGEKAALNHRRRGGRRRRAIHRRPPLDLG